MCWLTDWLKELFEPKVEKAQPEPEQKPDWVTQSREEVAEEELYAASIHLTYIELLKTDPAWAIYGDTAWHERWLTKHTEAAWYTAPEYTEKRLGK